METIVALSVLLAAIVGPVAVVTRSVYSFPAAKNRLIALNLSQEGIEGVRLIRENNILCKAKGAPGWKWDRDYNGTGTIQDNGDRTIDLSDMTDAGQCDGVQNPTMAGACLTTPLRIDDNGVYGYVGAQTIFFRCISVLSVTQNESAPEAEIPKQDMIDVVSTISWQERGVTKNIVLKERLYNWE